MAKLNDIRTLAETHASEISRSVQAWTGYLDTAAQLYRYSFADTLLIHAQRPDATACVELETWNSRMGRWVNRGAKGIALIDDSGPSKRLRYVFDISDTHMVRGGKTPYLWQMDAQLRPEMADYLMDTYGLEYDPDVPLSTVLMALARAQVADNLADAMDGLSYEVRGTYLEGLGEDTVQESFRRLLENSTYYLLAKRCGLDPMEELTADDFSGLSNFNRLSVLSFLGNAAHDIAEPVLRDIGREVIFRYRVLATERKVDEMLRKRGFSIESGNVEAYNGFNTLIRESENEGQEHGTRENTEGGTSDESDLHEEGRLPVSEPVDRRGAGGDREVRNAAQDIPEGEHEELVSEHAAVREVGKASRGDRPDSGRAGGADLGRDGTEGRRGREAEGRGPDGMDPAHEQHPEPRGRDRAEGIGVQLIPEEALDDIDEIGPIDPADSVNDPDVGTSEGPASYSSEEANETETQETSEAEDNSSPAFFMPPITVFPAYPTAGQQRRQIEQHMDAVYAGESNIPAEVIDEFLRAGGNRTGSQLRIIYSFMTDPAPEEAAEYVRREYGKGGKGLTINSTDYSVWFDEAGMKFATGRSVEDPVVDKAYLSWEDVSGRIRQLLAQGEYAPQSVLDAARGNALQEHATALVYMEHDLAEGITEIVFENASIFEGGFPSAVQKVSERLADPTFLTDLIERLEGLSAAYAESPEIMRFPYYNPDRMLAQFRQFSKDYIPFDARDGFAWEEHPIFITEEEADAFLASGGPYSDGRISTYSFFLRHEDTQERADFLKDQYGTGGRSHALSGADDSYADYNAKGIVLNRGNSDHPAVYNMTYTQAARRVDYLISQDRFLTARDHVRMPAYEREQLAAGVIRFYNSLPASIQRPFTGGFYDSSTRREIASMIEDQERLSGLLSEMDSALAGIPETEPRYQLMVDALADLHAYAEGTYTLFPQPKQDIAVPDARQMSLTDLFEMNVPENAAQLQKHAAEPPVPTSNPFAWDPTVNEDEVITPLSAEAASEYNALKQEYRSSLVGFEQNGNFEFYGEDARIIAGLYGDDPLKKEFPSGTVDMISFASDHWQPELQYLWSRGNSVYLAGENKDGTHHETACVYREDFLPINARIRISDRDYRIDSVDFANGTVSLQDMTMAREARYPIFRTESVEYIRSFYEEQYEDIPDEEPAVEAPAEMVSTAGPAVETPAAPVSAVEPAMEPEDEPSLVLMPEEPVPETGPREAHQISERREEEIEQAVFDALQESGTDYGDYSPDQMDVLYDAAEKGYDIIPLCNPQYPPQQMQLIIDMLNMDEHSPVETLGMDEETDQPTCESGKEGYSATVAERVAGAETYADRVAVLREDQKPAHNPVKRKTAGKGSLIERLQSKKAEISENVGRPDFRIHARPEPAL